jgi:hypothetical protein
MYGACQPDVCTDLFTLGGLPAAAIGDSPVGMVTADFDGDGKSDVATANSPAGTVSVLLGKGNGIFVPKVVYSTGAYPSAMVAGDLNGNGNGDGKMDLATANSGKPDLSVLLGQGNGTFATKTATAILHPVAGNAMTVGDLNGDGKLDLAVVERLSSKGGGRWRCSTGKGMGIFRQRRNTSIRRSTDPSSAIGSPAALVFADFNGDGKEDLAEATVC